MGNWTPRLKSIYLNFHTESENYIGFYHQILPSRYLNILAAFDECRLDGFMSIR